jgi:hypothetical protein
MARVFFSYCHADEELRNKLGRHLKILERHGTIETWYDRLIGAGEDFSKEIDERIRTYEVILLLVSPDFLASDYCYEVEMGHAMERHKKGEAVVIPVILRSCSWHDAPFGSLLATPTDGKPVTLWDDVDQAMTIVTNAVRDSVLRLKKKELKLQPRTEKQNEPSLKRMGLPSILVSSLAIAVGGWAWFEAWREPENSVTRPIRIQPHELLYDEYLDDVWNERISRVSNQEVAQTESASARTISITNREDNGSVQLFQLVLTKETPTFYVAATSTGLGPNVVSEIMNYLHGLSEVDVRQLQLQDSLVGVVQVCGRMTSLHQIILKTASAIDVHDAGGSAHFDLEAFDQLISNGC